MYFTNGFYNLTYILVVESYRECLRGEIEQQRTKLVGCKVNPTKELLNSNICSRKRPNFNHNFQK